MRKVLLDGLENKQRKMDLTILEIGTIGKETRGDVCLYVWFIHKNEIIRDRKFWRRAGIKVDKNHLLEFNKYELIYELEKLNLGA